MRLHELARILDLEELTPQARSIDVGPDLETYGSGPHAGTPTSETETVDMPGAGVQAAAAETVDMPGAGVQAADADITRGYASDLMSDVLANAPAGGVLVTLQVHLNVIAVAGHAGLRAVIFSSGRTPDDDVIERAAAEGLVLYRSKADTFNLAGRLYELGLRGTLE